MNEEFQTPEIIYLQYGGEEGDTTWCKDQIEETDITYIRADVVDLIRADLFSAAAERDTLRQQLTVMTAERDELKEQAKRSEADANQLAEAFEVIYSFYYIPGRLFDEKFPGLLRNDALENIKRLKFIALEALKAHTDALAASERK
jgi:predicted nuclease with TOPRIM domain